MSDFFEFSLVPGHEENLHPFSKTHSGLTEASWTEADCEAVSPFLFLRGLETKTPFDTLKKEKKRENVSPHKTLYYFIKKKLLAKTYLKKIF